MTFLEWNNCIARHFFNPDRAGKNIHLFISSNELINLGRTYALDEDSDEDIWKSFLTGLRIGLAGGLRQGNIFDRGLYAADKWKQGGYQRLNGQAQDLPPYLSCLVFAVLPLLEIQGDYNANNYHDRMASFISDNEIYELGGGKKLQNLRNKLKVIDVLWEELSHWANNRRNGELGTFQAISFNNSWKFVGKPLSQCILPPTAIRKLPEFFSGLSLTPKTFYKDEFFKKLLVEKGGQLLGLQKSTIELIRKGDKDEIGQSVIEMVKVEFLNWTGEAHEIVLKDGKEKKIRMHTVVPLKLQFKISQDGMLTFSFRAKYLSEPPQDLKLGDFEDIYENDNWSKTLNLGFRESLELKDSSNKWRAVFEPRQIRLFIRGGHFLLGNQFYIETEKLSRTEGMYLLCKNDIQQQIREWCEGSCMSFKDQSRLLNVPDGYSFFWFIKPFASHNHFSELQVYSDKSISFRSGTGLRIGYLTYLNELLPEVEVSNADGTEKVFLKYQDIEEKVVLEEHPEIGGVWLLPRNILIGTRFCLYIDGVLIQGVSKTYQIDKPYLIQLSNQHVPVRNCFNVECDEGCNSFQGNEIYTITALKKLSDSQSFTPVERLDLMAHVLPDNINGNTLLNWLAATRECDITAFYHVFELILRSRFVGELSRIQQRRKSAVNLLDYLGYIDYDYRTAKIFALPPKLVSIPTERGRKALLIGCYDQDLLSCLLVYCESHSEAITLSIKKASPENKQLLIPDTVVLECNNVAEFEAIASNLHIPFDEWYLLKLKAILPARGDYLNSVISAGSTESWEKFNLKKKVFNRDNLSFEEMEGYSKDYALTECYPFYVPEYGLWINEDYFIVDKNWGKYLLIHYLSEKIETYDRELLIASPGEIFRNGTSLAIPAQLPLPKLFSRIMIQLSGEAPSFKQLNLKGKDRWYNIYRNIPGSFIENFFKFKLNIDIETTQHIL